MAVEPLTETSHETRINLSFLNDLTGSWTAYAATGALVAGAALLMGRQRRAGLAVACVGTALALIDQEDAVRACWDAIPGYLDHAERALAQLQEVVRDVADNRDKLGRILEE
ncbi:MAG: hypothetical protein ABR976_12645 [Terracidiphilus sp.]|jgi:hypothetical protein